MTRSSAAAALVVTLLLAVLLWERDVRPPVDRTTGALHPPRLDPATGELTPATRARPVTPAEALPAEPAPERTPGPTPDEMQQRRQRVLAELARRAPSAQSATEPASTIPSGGYDLQARPDDLGDTVNALNEQLMPHVDSCLDQRRARGVDPRGMLAVHVQLARAAGVGQIVEAVEPVSNSDVADPGLIDCVRQSAFSVDLPPPKTSGRSAIVLTIPLEAARDGAAPRRR